MVYWILEEEVAVEAMIILGIGSWVEDLCSFLEVVVSLDSALEVWVIYVVGC